MKAITIREIKARAVVYEKHAPLDAQLQSALVLGGLSTLLAIPASLLFTPVLDGWVYAGFFWFLGQVALACLALLGTPVGLTVNGLALAGYGLLLYRTRGLRTDVSVHLAWHRLALGLAGVGGLNLFILGLPALGIVLNLLVWLVAIVFISVLTVVILFGVLAGAAVR